MSAHIAEDPALRAAPDHVALLQVAVDDAAGVKGGEAAKHGQQHDMDTRHVVACQPLFAACVVEAALRPLHHKHVRVTVVNGVRCAWRRLGLLRVPRRVSQTSMRRSMPAKHADYHRRGQCLTAD